MKVKAISILCFAIFIAFSSYAQKISFCEKIDEKELSIKKKNEFIIKLSKEPIIVFIENKDTLKTDSVIFKIYSIDMKGKQVIEAIYKDKIGGNLISYSRKVFFKKEGLYDVIIYDDNGHIICSDYVKIIRKK